MKWLLRLGLVGAALVVAAIFLGPRLIATDGMVEAAETEANRVLGRQVEIGALEDVRLLPPRLTVTDFSIANAEGFDGPALVAVDQAELGVALLPLLAGQVKITTFVLDSPSVALETKADGTNNFTLGSAPAPAAAGPQETGTRAATRAPIVGTIVLRNGRVTYRTPETAYEANSVALELRLPELGGTLSMTAALSLDGIPVDAELSVDDPWSMTSNAPVDGRFELHAGDNRISGEVVATSEPLSLSGPVSVELDNIAQLAPLIGDESAAGAAPFGAISISGNADVTEGRAAFGDATFRTAVAEGRGDFVVELADPRPSLRGTIKIASADLRPFFPEASETQGMNGDTSFPPWSTDEIDLTALRAFDMDLDVSADEITLPTYRLTAVAASLTADAGDLDVSLANATAFAGRASGSVAVDASAATPRLGIAFEFVDIDFTEAAPALLGTDKFRGAGDFAFDVKSVGNSQKTWVQNLNGTASADVTDGAIVGIDLGAIAESSLELARDLRAGEAGSSALRSAFSGVALGAVGKEAATPFSFADMDVTIDSGVARVSEAALKAEQLRASVSGDVRLPEQRTDLSILLAARPPQADSYRQLDAPVTVTGTFSDPKIGIDPAPLIQSRAEQAAKDALGSVGVDVDDDQSIGDALRSRARGELLNLLGKKEGKEKEEDPPR